MRLQLVAVQEGNAVDALQHLPLVVAAPIGAGNRHQLERVAGHLAGMLQVRTAAQVLPVAVPVHAQRFVAGDRLDQLDLVGFVIVFVMLDRAVALPHLGGDGIAAVDDFLHLLFDLAQIFGGEGLGAVEIVIPAVVDHRADGDLGVGPDLLHGAGHDMGQVVAHQLVGLHLVLHGVNGDLGIAGDRPLQIPVLAVDGGGNRLFRQRSRDVGGDLGRGDPGLVVPCIAIGKGQGNLGHRP